jgi:hypothetical protein
MSNKESVIVKNIKWLMLIPGIITCSMIYAAIDPQGALMQTFGESISGPIAEIVVRNWGLLITMVGALMIYGAYRPQYRQLILTVAVAGKFAFVALNLIYGQAFFAKSGVALVFDSILIAIYLTYLMQSRQKTQ